MAARRQDFDTLAEEARKSGYIDLSLEIRLATAELAARSGRGAEAGKVLREVIAGARWQGLYSSGR